jgi:hypothetical protein
MLTDRRFWLGVGVGVAGVYLVHRYARPMPPPKRTARGA